MLYKESFQEKGDYIDIVMQYCEGGDLYKRIRNRNGKQFSERTVLNWIAQVVLALHFLHERKVLHRDLKTQNIFLSEDKLFLGDFGISKTLENTRELANTYIGTPYYMSPELFNYKPYSYKSDIWSLGCVLYEICNLRHAFNAQTINGLAIKILKGNYAPVSTYYSKELRDLISSLLVIDPKQRPSIRKIVQMPFVKKQILNYIIELGELEELNESILDSLKVQVIKIGLSSYIREACKDRPKVIEKLLSERKDEFEQEEVFNYKMQKELQLKREVEKRDKLEKEISGLKEKKRRKSSRNMTDSGSEYRKSINEEMEYSMDSFNDEYDEFEFMEEEQQDGDNIDGKIDEYERKRDRKDKVIEEIKEDIKRAVEKIDSNEVYEDEFDEEEFQECTDKLEKEQPTEDLRLVPKLEERVNGMERQDK